MKNFAILFLLAIWTTASFAGPAGNVQFVRGDVRVTDSAGRTQALKKGDVVNEGDTLISARTASAQIRMLDKGLIAVRPDTRIKIDSFKYSGKEDGSENFLMSLLKGGFRAVTGQIGRMNKKNYRVSSSSGATIGIRGTDHEARLVLENEPGFEPGTYSKVNVGETTLTTTQGSIVVQANQMGFAAWGDSMPQLRPIDTDLFSASPAPVDDTGEGDASGKDGEDEGQPVREETESDKENIEQKVTNTDDSGSSQLVSKDSKDLNELPIVGENCSGTTCTSIDLTHPEDTSTITYSSKQVLIGIAAGLYSNQWYSANPADMTYSSGGLTGFTEYSVTGDYTASYAINGASNKFTGSATSGTTDIKFGRWGSATSLTETYTNQLGFAGGYGGSGTNAWMYGAEGYLDPGVIPGSTLTGVFNYALDGNTTPIDIYTGQTGTLSLATMSADFTNLTVSSVLDLTVGADVWAVDALNMPISGNQFYASAIPGGAMSNTMTISLNTLACPTCYGNLTGAFTGQNYAGAMLSYIMWDNNNSSTYAMGHAAFSNTAPVTNGTAAPSGNYFVADYGGSINPYALTLTPGQVLTSYSNSFGQGFSNSTTVNCPTCTATPTGNAANTGIYYGTWDAGTITQSNTKPAGTFSPAWITGPEAGPLFLAQALTGTVNYTMDGGMVTNSMGVPGTVSSGTTSLTVDFNKQVVGINLDLSILDTYLAPTLHTWNAQTLPGDEAPIQMGNGIGGAAFSASSYNTGPGTLTVLVDGLYSGNGSIVGQLTGTGLNGAILSYDLDAFLSPTFEQINGVTAMVGPASNIATPHRIVLASLTDPGVATPTSVMGFYENAPSRMITDVSGNVTRFDINPINQNSNSNNTSTTLSSGSSGLFDAGNDPVSGISWGRWEVGAIDITDRATGVVTPAALSGSLHWIAGPTETTATTLPASGTYTYTNSGGTSPTDNLSGIGTLNNASLTANFTAQTVDVGINVTVGTSTMDAVALNTPIIQSTLFYADSQLPVADSQHLAVSCTGAGCGGSTSGVIIGQFTGTGATGAVMSYGLENIGGASTQIISGVAAFNQQGASIQQPAF